MRKVYDRIVDMRGNLITVIAQGVSLGEMARIHKRNGTFTYASVLRFDDDLVTLQVFESTLLKPTNPSHVYRRSFRKAFEWSGRRH
jgi:V/A-type H+-transporting ATPase subunit B